MSSGPVGIWCIPKSDPNRAYPHRFSMRLENGQRERQKLADKIDPLDIRPSKGPSRPPPTPTSRRQECADDYIAAHRVGWRSAKHGGQSINSLRLRPSANRRSRRRSDRYALCAACARTASGDVAGQSSGARAVTAERVRSRIELILAWAAARGHRPQGDSPAGGKGHINQILVAPTKNKLARGAASGGALRRVPGLMASCAGTMVLRSKPSSSEFDGSP